VIGIYFDTLQEWTKENWVEGLFNIAKQAGMTREKFDATLKDEQLARAILAIREDGAKFGVQGTPSFFVNGELYTGEDTFDAMKAKIDPLL
jgi:protein-disulfide isomerase